MVAVVALARNAEAGAPAARARLCARAAWASHAAFGLEMTGRRVGEAAVLDISDHLLDDSVPAVITLAIPQGDRRVGERGMVAPGVEERAAPGGDGTGAPALDEAHDQPVDDLLFLRRGNESAVDDPGCLGVGDPALALLVPDRLGTFDRCPGVLVDAGDGGP
ncbi:MULTISPECIES: hypothetical protein [unclassified Streptomyces]|uniref:hypothetical protein n=1 Tax=unclassified Streptomyces TaxID=2593676 RepID=UPI0038209865